MKTKKVAVDLATPHITEPMQTPEDMVTTGNDTIAKINASGNSAPEVAGNVTSWAAVIVLLDKNNQNKAKGHEMVRLAEAAEPGLIRRYRVRRNLVLGAVQSAGDGTAAGVQSFNLEVHQRTQAPLAVVPENLRAMKAKMPTYASVRWDVVPGAKGYMLQHCTNPADPTTYAPPISVTAARYHLTGQTPGITVYFRVLACDARLGGTGQTAYTAWLPVVVIG
jgi:hypothetical protein